MTRRHRPALHHHLAALALLSATATHLPPAAAEDLDAEDVPPECAALCAPVVQLTGRCEAQAQRQFGIADRRWLRGEEDAFELPRISPSTNSIRKRRRRRMEESLERRQGARPGSDSDSHSDAEDPREAEAERAARACMCGERGFDVAAVAGACAACIGRNAAAVEADEDIKEIMAECGFTAAPPPSPTSVPPANLAPVDPSSTFPTSSSTPPTPTVTSPPEAPAQPTPETPGSSSVTPVTVFATPSFRTLPPVIVPNDFRPERSDVKTGAAAASLLSGGGWGLGALRVACVLVAILVSGY